MKLAYYEVTPQDEGQLTVALPQLEIVSFSTHLDMGHLPENGADINLLSVFVDSRISTAMLDALPNLKLIATRSTGYDHIDLVACKQKNITVCNVPSYGENTVAEHAFALILALSRKIFQSYERTEKMDFTRAGLEGFDLQGKTLGVIGCGAIGRHSIRIGQGFGMQIIAYDVHPDVALAKQLGFTYADSITAVLQQSDVITLHTPYLPQTHHLINMENIKLIKPGAILINTARGALVDTQALLWALDNHILSGAGLDVLEDEEDTFDHVALLSANFSKTKDMTALLRNHILIDREDVIITPHNAFNSREARQRIFTTNLENIRAFIAGQSQNVVH